MRKAITILFLLIAICSYSQTDQSYQNLSKNKNDYDFHSMADLGFGMGLNYGGFMGAQIEYVVIDHLGVFGSAGFYIIGFGWQTGVKGYIMPKVTSKPFRVYGTAMYGTNSAIMVENGDKYNKIYSGFSVGTGLEIRFGKSKRNGINIDLFYPVRSNEFYNDWETVKSDPLIENYNDPIPITFSVGYHLEIR